MCQQYAGEKSSMLCRERDEIEEITRKHKSGESVLTPEQIRELNVRIIMLNDY